MERCYEYLGCDKQACIMHDEQNDHKQCWEVEGTLHNHHGIEIVNVLFSGEKKEKICARSGCIYYKAARDS